MFSCLARVLYFEDAETHGQPGPDRMFETPPPGSQGPFLRPRHEVSKLGNWAIQS